MLRVVVTKDDVAFDPRQVMPGRGAYVHPEAACLDAAVKQGGLARALRCKVGSGLLTGVPAKAPSRSGSVSQGPKGSKDS
jgi:predicted RNA-binding protein YlxR (DUF448 family)